MKSPYLLTALGFVAAHSHFPRNQNLQIRSFGSVGDYIPTLWRRGSPPPPSNRKARDGSSQRSRPVSEAQSPSSGGRSSSQAPSQDRRSRFNFSFPPVRPAAPPPAPASGSSNPPQQPPQGPQHIPGQDPSRSHAGPSGPPSAQEGGQIPAAAARLPERKAGVDMLKSRARTDPFPPDATLSLEGWRVKSEVMASVRDAEQKRAMAQTLRRQVREKVKPIIQGTKNPTQFFGQQAEQQGTALRKHRLDAQNVLTTTEAHVLEAKTAGQKATSSGMYSTAADQFKKAYRGDSRRHIYVAHDIALRHKIDYEHLKHSQQASKIPQAKADYKSAVGRLRKTVSTHADVQNAFSGSSSSESEGEGFSDVSE